jgi:hypothetical protein
MIKGSLNSMNYLEPNGFINKFKYYFKRHHYADIIVQYEVYSIRAFDFHIDFDKNGKAFFKYDGISYKTKSIYGVLNYLGEKNNIYIKVIFEGKGATKEKRFSNFCHNIEQIYSNINFFGGYSEKDAKILYIFKKSHIAKKIYWYNSLY